MKIKVNNGIKEIEEGITLNSLLQDMGIGTAGIAVALNGNIARRAEWDALQLNDGDEVTIIKAAYGG